MGQELSETGRRRIQTVFPEYLSSLGSLGPSFRLHLITAQLCRSAFTHSYLHAGSSPATTSPQEVTGLTDLQDSVPGAEIAAAVT